MIPLLPEGRCPSIAGIEFVGEAAASNGDMGSCLDASLRIDQENLEKLACSSSLAVLPTPASRFALLLQPEVL